MAEVTAALVKQLREQTGAGMMDCKAALKEAEGDLEAATDWLRKKGLAAAAKRAGRVASEGLIGVHTAGGVGAMVEVNSETDFVARNQEFQDLVTAIAAVAPEADGDLDRLLGLSLEGGQPVSAAITDAVARIGENITLRRTAALQVGEGVVGSYVHAQLAPGLGKIGVLLPLQSAGDAEQLGALARQVAMHVAASRPLAVSVDRLDPQLVARERAIYADQARATGKPDTIIEKIVEGRVRKWYEESVLLEQPFVIDPDIKVRDAVERLSETLGTSIAVTDFVRFALGEGLEPKGSNLADEVAALAGA